MSLNIATSNYLFFELSVVKGRHKHKHCFVHMRAGGYYDYNSLSLSFIDSVLFQFLSVCPIMNEWMCWDDVLLATRLSGKQTVTTYV